MPIILMLDPDFPITPEHEVYWKALGRFIHRFAMLEQQIAHLLALYAETPKGISQAVFSGVRAPLALSLIDRVRETKETPEDPDWNRLRAQFGIINSVRNDIVHLGAIMQSGGFKISNQARTIPSQVKTTSISATELDAMTDDIQTMAATIYVHQCIKNDGHFDAAKYATDWAEVGRAPWKYTLPKPPPGQRKPRGKIGKRERPPRS
jgi:hypothetical protein